MRSSRHPRDERAHASRADAAAQRLALLAADLSRADPPPGASGAVDPWWSDHTRIAPARRTEPPAGATSPAGPTPAAAEQQRSEPSRLPIPGRHAARRRRALSPAAVTVPVLGPAQLTVVAVMVAVALAATAWWVVRGRAEPVPPPVAPGTVEPLVAAASETASPSGSASPGATVTVDVTGKVRRPGIVVLDVGARVVDALEAAGGARPGVDLTGINLARVLTDGEQILVGAAAATAPAAPSGAVGSTGPAPPGPGALVNLNLATPAELETLPDVGPVTAAAIVAWREEHGGFTSVDELLEVQGIGEVTLANIAPYVTV